ncbi:MAG: 4-hydroxy-3-methylbut-2-enyl diphosphate reductase [Spirochaetia bacterium]|nr:4-hydroxy-3-methylbut-2-enyl diphosphate reductase [Spirochaetia bacterium]
MQLILSDAMGYCKGVSRAISMVEQAIGEAQAKGVPVYSLGKVIHNQQVCSSFAQRGLQTISSPDGHPPGLVVLRAHGVADALRLEFVKAGFTVMDATCPVVSRNLNLIALNQKDAQIVIVGHENHPETLAMQGVQRDGKIYPSLFITRPDDVLQLQKGIAYAVFVQTTFDRLLWRKIQAAFHDLISQGYSIEFRNEVCPSSVNRRDAALRLCQRCDAILVVGGKESANTQALYTLIADQGKKAWHIETEDEVTSEMKGYAILGITAGASTPQLTIDAVLLKLKEN